MNFRMTLLADDESFATACGHAFDPGRFFAAPGSIQVSELADMVNFTVAFCAAQFASLS